MKQSQGKASPVTSGGRKETGFPFRVLDYQAGEAWLNELGAEGWRLEGIENGRLRFRRTAEPVSYAVELEQFLGCIEEQDFRAFCADAGWEKAGELGELVFYASAPGRSPAPFHTDEAVEVERFTRQYLVRHLARFGGWLAVMVLPRLAELLLFPEQVLARMDAMPGYGLLMLAFTLLLLILAAAEGRDVVWLLRCRRAGRFLTRSPAAVRRWKRGVLGAMGAALLLAAVGTVELVPALASLIGL